MTPRVITFDCAQTLVRVSYNPADLAVACANDVGLVFEADEARSVYMRLVQGGWTDYMGLNLSRNPAVCRKFWAEIGAEWLRRLELPEDAVGAMMEAGDRRLYGPESRVFQLFDDTLPCLERLRTAGVRCAVVSNWDYTLHRVLETQGIAGYFERAFASLEEGVEKPDRRLFSIAAKELGVALKDLVHVGDDPLDDFDGAQNAGCKAILLDRGQSHAFGRIIPSLDFLEEAIACC